jgi:hypothetical protein
VELHHEKNRSPRLMNKLAVFGRPDAEFIAFAWTRVKTRPESKLTPQSGSTLPLRSTRDLPRRIDPLRANALSKPAQGEAPPAGRGSDGLDHSGSGFAGVRSKSASNPDEG